MNSLFTDLKQKDMLIDNTNDKVTSKEEKAIWKILDDYKLNPMLQPNCANEIIELVNKLFIQRVSNNEVAVCDCKWVKGCNLCGIGRIRIEDCIDYVKQTDC